MVSVTSSTFDSDLLAVRIVPSANPAFHSLPKHIGFLVDTSGSMSEHNRLVSVQRTLALLIQAKPAPYRMTLVSFAATATLVSDAVADADALQTAVASLAAVGGTNLEAGVLMLREADRRNPMDAVVLLTDGDVTAGSVMTTAGLMALVKSSFPRKIPIHTIGYGEGYNRALLTAIAKVTRSLHMYADAAEALPAVAGDILAGVQSEVGTEATLLLPPSYRCLEGNEEGEYTIGTLIADKEQWIVLRKTDVSDTRPLLLRYKASDGEDVTHAIPLGTDLRRVDMAAQRDRVLSTQTMTRIYDEIEARRHGEALTLCRDFLKTLEASEATDESLVVSLKAQFVELVEQLTPVIPEGLPPGVAPPPPRLFAMGNLLSRLASNTVALTTQRGFVSRMASGGTDTHTFSSPSQQVAQRSMTQSYTDP